MPPTVEEVLAQRWETTTPAGAALFVARCRALHAAVAADPAMADAQHESIAAGIESDPSVQAEADQLLAEYQIRQNDLAAKAAERPKHSGERHFAESRELRSSGPSAGQLLALMRRQMELTLVLTGHVGDGQVAAWYRDLAEFEAEVAAHEAV